MKKICYKSKATFHNNQNILNTNEKSLNPQSLTHNGINQLQTDQMHQNQAHRQLKPVCIRQL